MYVYNRNLDDRVSKNSIIKGLCYKIEDLPFNLDYQEIVKLIGDKHITICNGDVLITNFGVLKLIGKFPKIKIAICGCKNSGKYHLAHFLSTRHTKFQIMSYFDTLKTLTQSVFNYIPVTTNRNLDEIQKFNNDSYEIELVPSDIYQKMYEFISSVDNQLIIEVTNKIVKSAINQGNDVILYGVKTQRQYEYVNNERFKIIFVENPDLVDGPIDKYDDYLMSYVRDRAHYVFSYSENMSDVEKISAKNRVAEFCFKDVDFGVLKSNG